MSLVQIEYVAGPNTPPWYRHLVGTKTFPFDPATIHIPRGQIITTLMGIPGCLRPGWTWEIGGNDASVSEDRRDWEHEPVTCPAHEGDLTEGYSYLPSCPCYLCMSRHSRGTA